MKENDLDDYNKLIDFISANITDFKDHMNVILNDYDFFTNPAETQKRAEKFLHDKKFKDKIEKL